MGLVFLMFGLTSALAQEKDVSGTVTDLSNMPLPGASIVVKGTTRGVSSDFDGNYTIKVNQGDVLVFSFIGYTNKEVTVGSSSTVNVQLEEDAQSLQEVVVTAFGKPKPKREMASSVAILTSEDLTDVTNTNPFESLSGKIAGVDISTPAQNGATSKVIIRGFSSLGSNQPLYIVDGSPINNTPNGTAGNAVNRTFDGGSGLNDIDPNSIENITVLKGAAAAALYGSRASNGVILITT
ncbi:MAG TPA: TonB-dependent receptor plug domain-containing protein, partial [Mangrovimonas sp.]|nr:TonB-dependent receptor plug domain-containing protein [Mangrovimonas sp.]